MTHSLANFQWSWLSDQRMLEHSLVGEPWPSESHDHFQICKQFLVRQICLTKNCLQIWKWWPYKGRGVISVPICAKKVRNSPPSANQGCSTASQGSDHVHRTYLQNRLHATKVRRHQGSSNFPFGKPSHHWCMLLCRINTSPLRPNTSLDCWLARTAWGFVIGTIAQNPVTLSTNYITLHPRAHILLLFCHHKLLSDATAHVTLLFLDIMWEPVLC